MLSDYPLERLGTLIYAVHAIGDADEAQQTFENSGT